MADGRRVTRTAADVAKLSFEDALAELEAIVKKLEGGQGSLEDAISAYQRGAELRKHCEDKLAEAEAKVSQIVVHGGAPAEAPYDTGEA